MAIESFERILAQHPFFEGLSQPDLDTVVGCAANVTFQPGQFLFRAGEPADRFYVMREGTVSVEIFAPGVGAVTFDTVEAGEVLGFSWLVPPYRGHFDVRAMGFVRAFALDGVCLRGKCEKDPTLGYQLLKRVSQVIMQRLEAMQIQLLDVYASDSQPRPAR
jgi:CRP-like cAMP-binding protein